MISLRTLTLAVCWLLLPAAASAQPLLDQLQDSLRRDADQPEKNRQELPAPAYLGAILDDRQQAGGIQALEVIPDGPAAKGGLQKSDLITSINGKPVRVMKDLAQFITGSAAGDKLDLEVTRPGTDTKPEAKLELKITLGVRPPRSERRFPEFGRIPEPPREDEPLQQDQRDEREKPGLLGVRAVPLDPVMARQLRLPVARGAVVIAVVQGSAADRASLPREAVIVAVNNRAIDSPDDLARRVQMAGPGSRIELAYYYGGQLVRRQVTLAEPSSVSPDRRGGQEQSSLEQRIERLEAEVRELRRQLESR